LFPALRARDGQGYTRGYATRDNKNHRKVTPRFRARLGHDYGDVTGTFCAGTTVRLRICLDSPGRQYKHGSSAEDAKDVTWEVSSAFPPSLH
jgi:hypothetical protein